MENILEKLIFVDFVRKKILIDKVRVQCHLTGKYRAPAYNTCNINVTQKQSSFIPFIFHNLNNYDCLVFFEKSVDKKNDKAKFRIIPKTNEKKISVTYGCVRFRDSYRFLSLRLDETVYNLDNNDFKLLKKASSDKGHFFKKTSLPI